MSNIIDNRVVDMQFNNQQFENGVGTTLKSLDALKKGLNLEESSRSLLNLGNVAKSFSLGGIADGVDNISGKFSAFGAIGFTILQNLTNSAINFGKQLVNSLMIAPLKQGLAEYETQMNAVQTIMANTAAKGTTLDQVNAALDELNTYADKTIYNFSEMTRNIGTFTAAGVDLKTSTAAIKGIANLAAVSGSNAQQASMAMYQLSQAMASGTVKLMDWNSVVNAGMGGQVFQDALKETARVHKINIDGMIKTEGSFRETLQKGWLTTDILTETLSKFTGDLSEQQLKTMGYTEAQIKEIIKLGQTANDAATKVKTFTQLKDTLMEAIQSGWAKSWQLVLGDFEEAKSFFTEVSDTLGALISDSAEARNTILGDWKKFGGRVVLIDAVRNAFQGVLSIIKPIQEGFREIFPPITGQQLKMLTVGLRDLAAKLKLSDATSAKFKSVFKGVASAIDIVRRAIMAILGHLFKLKDAAGNAASGFLDLLAKGGDWVTKLRDSIIAGDTFNEAIERMGGFILIARDRIVAFVDAVKNNKQFQGFIGFIVMAATAVANFARTVAKDFGIIKSWFATSFSFKGPNMGGFAILIQKIGDRLKSFGGLGKIVGGVFLAIGKAAKFLSPIFAGLSKAVGTFFTSIKDWITKKMTKIDFSHMFDGLAEAASNIDFNKTFDAVNGGIIAAILLAIKKFLSGGMGSVKDVLDVVSGFKGILGGVQDVLGGVKDSLVTWQNSIKSKTLLTIAIAIAILAASLIALSLVDSKKLTTALMAISVMFADLMGAFEIYSKASGTTDAKAAGVLLIMAAGLVIMTGAVATLAKIDPKALTSALIGLSVILAEIAVFMKVTDFSGLGLKSSVGLVIMAVAIGVLALAVSQFAKLDGGSMKQGLLVMAAVLGELAAFVNMTGNSKNVLGTALGLLVIAASMLVFSEALKKMGDLSWEEIGKGLAAMAGSLLVIFTAVRSSPKGMLSTALGLAVISLSLMLLSKALKGMGGMSWEELGKGLAALAGSMLILAVAVNAMQGGLAGAAALVIVSAALNLLVPVLVTLGSMSLAQIGTALLALAGTFVVLGAAGLILAPMIPVLLALSAVLLLFGLACTAVGVGVLTFSMGIAALAVSGAAGAAALGALLISIGSIIPLIIKLVVGAIVNFATQIAQNAPLIATAFKTTLLTLIDTIKSVAPAIFDALTVLLLGLIDTVIKTVPAFVTALMTLINTLLSTLVANVPKFIDAGFKLIMAFLKGIRDHIGEMVTVAIDIVNRFLNAIASKIPSIIDSGFKVILAFINGLADAVDKYMPQLNAAIKKLADAIIDGLVKGILDGVDIVVQAIKGLVRKALAAFASKEGLDSHSPSKKTMAFGKNIDDGLALGVKQNAGTVVDAVSELSGDALNGMSAIISHIADSLKNNMDMQPSIRPVVDLTEVVSGSNAINDLMNFNNLNLTSTVRRVANVATAIQSGPIDTAKLGPATSTGETKIELTQINNSPKALSTLEIYRQTRNQLNTMKDLVKNK